MSAITLRIATTAAERQEIYRLRYQVYTIENGFQRPGPADHRAWEDRSDAASVHLCAVAEGRIIGALRVIFGADAGFSEELVRTYSIDRFDRVAPRDKMAIAGRFVLRREYRAGPAMLQLLVESARQQRARGIELLFADSQLAMTAFYLSLGFRTYAPPFQRPVAGTVAPFVLIAGDQVYLHSVGSPLLELADDEPPQISEVARRAAAVIAEHMPLLSARSHSARFYQALTEALGPLPFASGPLSGLTESELRRLLTASYIADWPAGAPFLRGGHHLTEWWILLSGEVEVEGAVAPPGSVLGGVDARIGAAGARLLSIDARKVRQLLDASPRRGHQLMASLSAHRVERATHPHQTPE